MNPSGGASFPASLVLLGAGKMGGALLQGWLDLGLEAARVRVVDPQPSDTIAALCAARGVALDAALGATFGAPPVPPEVLVLAIKPQMLETVAPRLGALASEATLVISILAGKTLQNIADRLPGVPALVRAMPNLAAAVGQGMTGAVASAEVSAAQRQIADALLAAVGQVEWLSDEALIDAVTAVSGSGPAYVFYLAECLAEAGRVAGLPEAIAERLARSTVEGAGALLQVLAAETPRALRESVTSKGGTTAAALDVLMGDNGLRPLLEKAVLAAKKRAAELAG